MGTRIEFQNILEHILGERNVHFQPPPDFILRYPTIVYDLSGIRMNRADNGSYSTTREYLVTLIDRNPDSRFVDELSKLRMSTFDRHYISDNLHHYIFRIFY